MSDADALLAAVLADPDADLPRLVYADYLDDAGRPERAEFIRVQLARAADPTSLTLRAREEVLLHRHREGWLAPLRAKGEPLQNRSTHGRFRRGFVEEVWMPAGVFLHAADTLFRRAPVRGLRLTRADWDELTALATGPHLGRLRELTVAGWRYGDRLAALLAAAPAAALPPVLCLRGCGITAAGARVLAEVGPGWRPTELRVWHNPLVGDGGLEVLQGRFGPAVRLDG